MTQFSHGGLTRTKSIVPSKIPHGPFSRRFIAPFCGCQSGVIRLFDCRGTARGVRIWDDSWKNAGVAEVILGMILAPIKAISRFLAFAWLAGNAAAQIGGTGWQPVTPTFNVQWPYNVPEDTRYWFTNGIYHCLVFSNDAPFASNNTTLPRTEQRFTPDYTNGEIQYQATLMAASNENSYCLFQIHTGDAESDAYGSTTFMLFWFLSDGGSVHDYSGTLLASNLDNQWFQLNVDHNLVTRNINVWINRTLVWTQQDNGAGDFYFKDGVYEQSHGPTLQMDTWLTNELMWVSSGTNPPAAPDDLAAAPGTTRIALTWSASVNATNYNLKRSLTNGGLYARLAGTSGTNYTDTAVAGGTAYFYVVSALDQFGESANSVQVSAWLSNTVFRPRIVSCARQGANLMFSGNGGQPEGTYYVVDSTNAVLALSQWTRIATNSFDANGDFTFTNAISSNKSSQLFYSLQTH
jgi:hypothetical protein